MNPPSSTQSSTEQLRCTLGSGDSARVTEQEMRMGEESASPWICTSAPTPGVGHKKPAGGGGHLHESRDGESMELSACFFCFCG